MNEREMLKQFKEWMDFYSPDWMKHFSPGDVEPLRKCWFAATIKASQPEVEASADTYFAGIDDAISYLNGCTFAVSEMPTVRGVISLLNNFKRQGGYSAYKLPACTAALSDEAKGKS